MLVVTAGWFLANPGFQTGRQPKQGLFYQFINPQEYLPVLFFGHLRPVDLVVSVLVCLDLAEDCQQDDKRDEDTFSELPCSIMQGDSQQDHKNRYEFHIDP